VLTRFDTTFAGFANAFHRGEYTLWLGSGISRDKVDNVSDLLERLVELLRSSIDTNDEACAYRTALQDVLDLASLTPEELESLDYSAPVVEWPLRLRIIGVLVNHYSKVLDVRVGEDKDDDYLVWTGLDVSNTYGSADLEPDVEHYCIAVLMLEGLVGSAVTANWDGLLEKAIMDLSPAFDAIARVVVRPEDFRQPTRRIEIIKFHGCAVRAVDNEALYRPLLVARESQISGWTAQPENQSMRQHLEVLYTDRPTLMIGLSAQDANLQTVFANAVQSLARPWPASPPAIVLSEEELKAYHRNLLSLTYGSNYAGNATPIAESALLGSFGKPTLLALVLHSLTAKLTFLMDNVVGASWDSHNKSRLTKALVDLRDAAAHEADADRWAFLTGFIGTMSLMLNIFRTGHPPNASDHDYIPLSDRPVTQAIHSIDYPGDAFGWLGVAISLVGRGHTSGHWSVLPGRRDAPGEGVIRLIKGGHDARVFFVKDSRTWTALELSGLIDSNDANIFIVSAEEEPPAPSRSPRPRFGRSGKVGAAHFSIAASMGDIASADDLYEAFKLAGGF
jgi:hypothetical protein